MDQGMFNRFNVVNYFIAMTVALSICGFVAGLVSTWMILTTLETLGLTFGDAAVLEPDPKLS